MRERRHRIGGGGDGNLDRGGAACESACGPLGIDAARGSDRLWSRSRCGPRFNCRNDARRSRLRPISPDMHGDASPSARSAALRDDTTYRLHWQVLSVDGHITGAISFRVGLLYHAAVHRNLRLSAASFCAAPFRARCRSPSAASPPFFSDPPRSAPRLGAAAETITARARAIVLLERRLALSSRWTPRRSPQCWSARWSSPSPMR